MILDGTEGEQITIEEAAEMTAKYRIAHPNEIKGHYIGKNLIKTISSQEECMGIRIYHGLNVDGSREVILVGVNEDGNDMLEIIVDRSSPCPNMCSKPNALNGLTN